MLLRCPHQIFPLKYQFSSYTHLNDFGFLEETSAPRKGNINEGHISLFMYTN